MKLSGTAVLKQFDVTVADVASMGISPCMFLRENEQTADVISDHGKCYGHIPKGLCGRWPQATASAVKAFFDGNLDIAIASNPALRDETATLFGFKNPNNVDSGFLLPLLLGRKPKHDASLCWSTSGTTLARMGKVFEAIQVAWLEAIAEATGNPIMQRRANLRSRLASKAEVEARTTEVLALALSGNTEVLPEFGTIQQARATGGELHVLPDGTLCLPAASDTKVTSDTNKPERKLTETELERIAGLLDHGNTLVADLEAKRKRCRGAAAVKVQSKLERLQAELEKAKAFAAEVKAWKMAKIREANASHAANRK